MNIWFVLLKNQVILKQKLDVPFDIHILMFIRNARRKNIKCLINFWSLNYIMLLNIVASLHLLLIDKEEKLKMSVAKLELFELAVTIVSIEQIFFKVELLHSNLFKFLNLLIFSLISSSMDLLSSVKTLLFQGYTEISGQIMLMPFQSNILVQVLHNLLL